MRYGDYVWAGARILFGLFFIYAPLMVIVQFGGQNPPETNAAASAFARALDASGFMNPLIIGSMLVAGAALLFDRSAAIGLAILAPSIVVIACFHWFLTGQYIWGTIWPVWFALLAWRYRSVLLRLWGGRTR